MQHEAVGSSLLGAETAPQAWGRAMVVLTGFFRHCTTTNYVRQHPAPAAPLQLHLAMLCMGAYVPKGADDEFLTTYSMQYAHPHVFHSARNRLYHTASARRTRRQSLVMLAISPKFHNRRIAFRRAFLYNVAVTGKEAHFI